MVSKFLIFLTFIGVFELVSSDYIRPCYFTDWAHYRNGIGKYDPEAYIPGLCTHILFAFAKINNDFTADAFDPADLADWNGNVSNGYYARVNALKAKQPDLKTLLSFGGYSAGTALFKQMAASPQSRQTFINSAINFITLHGFDGIDVDWEYPDASDKQVFVSLMNELKQAAGNKLVTIAATANFATVDAGYDVEALIPALDFVLIMTYDFHGGWEQVTGQNSPLFSAPGDTTNFNTAFAMNYWAQKGMSKNKLIVGIATYGRGWVLSNPSNTGIGAPGRSAPPMQYTGTDGFGAYYEICALGGTVTWDDAQKVPSVVKGNLWYGYDDVQSVTTKMQWIKDNGFGGAFVWTLDFDDFTGVCGQTYPLLNAIKNGLGGGNGSGPQPTPSPINRSTTRFPGVPSIQPTVRPVTQNPNQPFQCPVPDGFFADPQNCSRYYQCYHGVAYHFTCGSGLLWNDATKACDWPSNVNCNTR